MPFTRDDDLRLSIRMGLTKGLRLIRGMRRQLDEDERNRVAEAIREHLVRANWRIEKGEPIGGHSQLSGGPGSRDGGGSVDGGNRASGRISSPSLRLASKSAGTG